MLDYRKHITNQDNFNIWVIMDPDMKSGFKGTDANCWIYFMPGTEIKKQVKANRKIKAITAGEEIMKWEFILRIFFIFVYTQCVLSLL